MQPVRCYVSGEVDCKNEGRSTKQKQRGRNSVAAGQLWRSLSPIRLCESSQNLHYQSRWKCLISIPYNREQISLLYAILGYMPYFLMENEMLILTVQLAWVLPSAPYLVEKVLGEKFSGWPKSGLLWQICQYRCWYWWLLFFGMDFKDLNCGLPLIQLLPSPFQYQDTRQCIVMYPFLMFCGQASKADPWRQTHECLLAQKLHFWY